MNDPFDIHFKGMRIPEVKQTKNSPLRLFWCPKCGCVHDDFDAGNFVKYIYCFCGNNNCVEITPEENVRNILAYMRENKKARINKEDLTEILI